MDSMPELVDDVEPRGHTVVCAPMVRPGRRRRYRRDRCWWWVPGWPWDMVPGLEDYLAEPRSVTLYGIDRDPAGELDALARDLLRGTIGQRARVGALRRRSSYAVHVWLDREARWRPGDRLPAGRPDVVATVSGAEIAAAGSWWLWGTEATAWPRWTVAAGWPARWISARLRWVGPWDRAVRRRRRAIT